MKHHWTQEQITALRDSISHWDRIVTNRRAEEAGAITCPLCQRWHYNYTNQPGCSACPVAAYTSQNYCRSTPYYVEDDLGTWSLDEAQEDVRYFSDDEFRALAHEELTFLKKVLASGQSDPVAVSTGTGAFSTPEQGTTATAEV